MSSVPGTKPKRSITSLIVLLVLVVALWVLFNG